MLVSPVRNKSTSGLLPGGSLSRTRATGVSGAGWISFRRTDRKREAHREYKQQTIQQRANSERAVKSVNFDKEQRHGGARHRAKDIRQVEKAEGPAGFSLKALLDGQHGQRNRSPHAGAPRESRSGQSTLPRKDSRPRTRKSEAAPEGVVPSDSSAGTASAEIPISNSANA